ncbi:MAG: ADP-forming succinate--CoA ligase subunit beta [Candidatus Bipolaricaulia bacterium]
MNLLEYQGKELFERAGLPVPESELADTASDARAAAERLGPPVVVKAQVATGGRGKAGGVKVAKSGDEAESAARELLDMTIQDEPVKRLMVADAVDIAKEYYLSITLDRAKRSPILIFSTQGGVDIEEVAETSPDEIHRVHVSPLEGLQAYQLRKVFFEAQVPTEQLKGLVRTAQALYRAFEAYRAQLVEINPLVVLADGSLSAIDSKFILDDSDLPEDVPQGHGEGVDPLEQEANEAGLQYVKLDGHVGIIGNGAGLVMSTLDVVQLKGGAPANFLDIGGGASAEQMETALRLVLSDDQVTGVFINIFGGITRCDLVAQGIAQAAESLDIQVPVVVRLVGTNEAEGREVLESVEGLHPVSAMEVGAEQIAELTRS